MPLDDYKFCNCRACQRNRTNAAMLLLQLQLQEHESNILHILACSIASYYMTVKIQPKLFNVVDFPKFFNSIIQAELGNMMEKYKKENGETKEEIDKNLANIEQELKTHFDFKDFLKKR